ncbi:helix-turn-helix transcriptional regulator [Flavobacterium sp. UBA6046]|jgi:transcriptional regulator with XRE-family HTH domain|uniref:helix-turn-helix transcriptional regulator n=1 Tax=Flavobacterium sp. UBA6046 TaxID=1946552 RepID=UPI0039C87897
MEQTTWKNNLKLLRIQHNLTQQQVAELIGHKSNDRISHWEKGQKIPSLKNLMKLSEVFRVRMEELYK